MAVITSTELRDAIVYAYSGRKLSADSQLAYAERLLPVGRAIVEKYSDAAPEAIKAEAIIRICGYFAEARFGGFVSNETKIPPSSHAAAFRNSGAQALVSPWKRRRAGRV